MPYKNNNKYLLLRALLKVLFVFSTHWSWGLFCLENQNSLSEASICCLEISHRDIFHLPPVHGWFKLRVMCAVSKLYLPPSADPPPYSSSLLGFPCGPLHPFPEITFPSKVIVIRLLFHHFLIHQYLPVCRIVSYNWMFMLFAEVLVTKMATI